MRKKMWLKYDLSGNKKDDVIDCLVKDNIISYLDDDYKMEIDLINHIINRSNNEVNYKIDLNKEKIIIKYNNY